jgi:hypothetical protein
MDKLLEIIQHWPPIGQGIFMLVVLCVLCATIAAPFKYLAVCVRGWPLKQHSEDLPE